jgi:hypothetical protein
MGSVGEIRRKVVCVSCDVDSFTEVDALRVVELK